MTTQWKIRIFFWAYILFLLIFVHGTFSFLALNTLLGYVPIELSFHLLKMKHKKSLSFVVLFLIWLLFYPNAPYVLTDLFHLSLLNPHSLSTGLIKSTPVIWLNYTYLIISALSCAIIGTIQLKKVCQQVTNSWLPHLRLSQSLLVVILTILSSIGIYMGRFLRIHSLYVLLTPTWIIGQISHMWTTNMWLFTLFLTVIQLVLYWLMSLTANQDRLPS